MAELTKTQRDFEAKRLKRMAEDKLKNDPGFKLGLAELYFSGDPGHSVYFKNEFGDLLNAIHTRRGLDEGLTISEELGSETISIITKPSLGGGYLRYFDRPRGGHAIVKRNSTEAVQLIETFIYTNFPRTSK